MLQSVLVNSSPTSKLYLWVPYSGDSTQIQQILDTVSVYTCILVFHVNISWTTTFCYAFHYKYCMFNLKWVTTRINCSRDLFLLTLITLGTVHLPFHENSPTLVISGSEGSKDNVNFE